MTKKRKTSKKRRVKHTTKKKGSRRGKGGGAMGRFGKALRGIGLGTIAGLAVETAGYPQYKTIAEVAGGYGGGGIEGAIGELAVTLLKGGRIFGTGRNGGGDSV